MGITLQVISFLLGFFAYWATGSLASVLGISVIPALAGRFTSRIGMPSSWMMMLGGLAALHLASGDWIGIALICIAMTLVKVDEQELKWNGLGLWLSSAMALAGIASGQVWLLTPGLMSVLYVACPKFPSQRRRWIQIAVIAAYALLTLTNPTQRDGNSVYIEHGKWATDTGDYGSKETGLRLKNETTYSYTWMVRLVSDRKSDILSLTSADSTAWIVTPTQPFTPVEISQLKSWVRRGGRLVIVADHTDYLGHARCLNELLAGSGLDIRYGSFLPEIGVAESSQGWLGERILTKTPTIATGTGMMPLMTAKGYFEPPDYSRPGFFGPCSPSVDDKFGRHMTGGCARLGMGTIVFWGDSTLFSNFSIFQPDSIALLARLASPQWCALASACCLAILAICLLELPALTLLIPGLILGASHFSAKTPNELLKKGESIAWAGDRRLVDDMQPPKASFSTAYALSSASGMIPRWTDNPNEEKGGIWVSENPPPSSAWKWLTPFLEVKHSSKNPTNPWDELARFVNAEATYTTSVLDGKAMKVDGGGLWTNEGLGSWWFGMGTSPARIEKISSFNEWVRSGKVRWQEPTLARSAGKALPCTAIIEGGKKLQLHLPRFEASPGQYVYLGAGVSGLVTDVDGKTMITGSRDKDCFGYANSPSQTSWVLVYDEDMINDKPQKK
jgi:hypothetical protein